MRAILNRLHSTCKEYSQSSSDQLYSMNQVSSTTSKSVDAKANPEQSRAEHLESKGKKKKDAEYNPFVINIFEQQTGVQRMVITKTYDVMGYYILY